MSKKFNNKIILIGFGSIGQAVMPLLIKELGVSSEQIVVITADNAGEDVAEAFNLEVKICALSQKNYEAVLKEYLTPGNFLINLSVDVSSLALIKLCQKNDVFYIDTCIEPWKGGYTDLNLGPSERSNYNLREQLLALKKMYPGGATTIVAHGANPGLVSHFTKRALMTLAEDQDLSGTTPQNAEQWAQLAHDLGVKVIHIAEKDTQETHVIKKPGEFVNTWSIDGFMSEGLQPAELGWGTHEKQMPKEGVQHTYGCNAAIYLNRPGLTTRVRTWTPLAGSFHGFLVTHNESISIADYFSLKNKDTVIYRPTVHYSYHPSSDAVLSIDEFIGNNFCEPQSKRLLMDEIDHGKDELGVLLMGHDKKAYWYGSRLSIEEARILAPHNNATSLQVAAGVLGGIRWALENPNRGILEPEELDFEFVLEVASPYLGTLIGVYSDWTPIQNRLQLFSEDIDYSDPWQFKNFLVA